MKTSPTRNSPLSTASLAERGSRTEHPETSQQGQLSQHDEQGVALFHLERTIQGKIRNARNLPRRI